MLFKINILLFLVFQLNTVFTIADDSPANIAGKIMDGSNGDALPEAIVKIAGTSKGTAADMDGKYLLKDVPAGKVVLQVSYVGYVSKTFEVDIEPGENLNLDAVLIPEFTITDTVVIEGIRGINTDAGMLLKQQKSENIFDGITEQQIKRSSDVAASDILKRVIGVSIVKDKFVYVRGSSERYNNTTLNGVLIPSTETDKKAFSFDLFPSNLLDNVIISKSFTPDQPGNYSGGLVQITTKEFPEKFFVSYNISGSYNTNTSGKEFFSYNAANKKVSFLDLGIDKSRKMPGIIPDRIINTVNFSKEELRDLSRSFSNSWKQSSSNAPVNGGFQLSAGNLFGLGNIPVGIIASYSYRNTFTNKVLENAIYNTDNTQLSGFSGRSSEYSVLWGGLLNLNVKITDLHKLGIKSTYTLSSEDETEYHEGFNTSENFDRKLYITKFTERRLFSSQVYGVHVFPFLNSMNFSWKASYSETKRDEPDLKSVAYQRERNSQDPYYAAINYNQASPYGGTRFFSELKDISRNILADIELPVRITLPFLNIQTGTKIKLGILAYGTDRTFDARSFGPALYLNAPYSLLYKPVDSLFIPENFDVDKMFYDEVTKEDDKYNAYENTYAGYLMYDLPVDKLRFVFGARFEYNEMNVGTPGRFGEPVNRHVKNTDVLPSVNVTYSLSDKMNVRGAYTQTLSRPELREIAPFSYTDFVTGVLVYGNAVDLDRSIVRNYDLRWEFFPQAGELLSLSLFYKKFDAPIEDVFLPTSTNKIRTFANARNGAINYGFEIEARKNLGFLANVLKDLTLSGNLSIIDSKVNLEGLGSTSTKTERRMQGQSPYMVNAGLFYDSYKLGTSANLSVNRFGDRIAEVGLNGFEDIIEKGRTLIDFSVSQKIFSMFDVKFTAKDILNQDTKFTQVINGEEKTIRRFKTGINYSLGLTVKY
jgi:outer membrane receptor protein involved in Fe transport